MERKFKVGDKAIYVGCLTQLNGDIVEIKKIDRNDDKSPYYIVGKRCDFYVGERSLKPLSEKYADKLIFRDNATILFKDGKRYVAKCCEGDTYDKEKGLLVCLAKANGIGFKELQEMLAGAEYQSQKSNKYKITLSEFWNSKKRLAIYCNTSVQGEFLFSLMINRGFYNDNVIRDRYFNNAPYILNDKDCNRVKINQQGSKPELYECYNIDEVDLNN